MGDPHQSCAKERRATMPLSSLTLDNRVHANDTNTSDLRLSPGVAWFLGTDDLCRNCEAIKHLSLPDTAITMAKRVSSGHFEGLGLASPLENLPVFCRIAGVLRPTADSKIHFEVWMPEKDWNGRILGVGNGGFAGSIGYQGLAGNLRRGFATSGSDAGHHGEGEDAAGPLAIRRRLRTSVGAPST